METVELMDPPGALLDKSRASSESMKPSNFTHVKPVKYIYIYLWIYMYQVKFSGQTSDIRTFGQPDRNSICIYIYMYYMFIHLNYIYIFTFIYIYIYIYWQIYIMIYRYVYRLRQTGCMHCKPFGCHGILQRERERTLCDRQEMAWFGHAVFPQPSKPWISSTTGTTCWCLTHFCVLSLNLFASHCSEQPRFTPMDFWSSDGQHLEETQFLKSGLGPARPIQVWTLGGCICVCNTCFHLFSKVICLLHLISNY